ncbi:MAG: hypothetical protein GWO16_14100 [Gammaproteobacteria bacterium]|nr:hypothetical protein [Gammaproteobacteria bacterium]NIR99062.1 hypothetical protein [Gammaproteobacteria bacterium]NIT64694.1 hypothetical protein [Gammaproteobacteria bacterium]NIV21652.1 hypothetical protein [Gammaproteobacteria bacterium]NIX10614.1 hypothetical protein [Gammaproteobacteria bacterium]
MKENGPSLDNPTPQYWWDGAQRLKHAADVAWAGYRTGGTLPATPAPGDDSGAETRERLREAHGYLMGLAIELAAIAVLQAHDPAFLTKPFAAHHIVELVLAAGVSLAPDEHHMLRAIESSLQWRKRADVALASDDPEIRSALSRVSVTGSTRNAAGKSCLDAIFQRLGEELTAAG